MKAVLAVAILLGAGLAVAGAPQEAAKPLGKAQIMDLLRGEVSTKRVTTLVEQRGINFEPTEEDFKSLQDAGADGDLIGALRGAKKILPPEVMLARHRARGQELESKKSYPEAEQAYRAALALAPQDASLYHSLGNVLGQQKKWREAVVAQREAVRLNGTDAEARYQLGAALRATGDLNGAITQWTDALRLKPDDPRPYEDLGMVFTERRDWNRAVSAFQGATRRRPDAVQNYISLGFALQNKGDLNGAIGSFREAVSRAPGSAIAHNNLGFALEQKGETKAAMEQYQMASQLDSQDPAIRTNLERLIRKAQRPTLGSKK